MHLSHDDQMRQMGYAPSKTGSAAAPVSQLTLAMVNRARATRPDNLAWRVRSQGGMKAFLQTTRTLQRLPAFAKGRRA